MPQRRTSIPPIETWLDYVIRGLRGLRGFFGSFLTRSRIHAVSVAIVYALLVVASADASAQSRIEGRVVDPNGAVVAGATVVAVGLPSTPVSVRTDDEGRFVVDGVADGRYDLTASAPGMYGEVRGVSTSSTVEIKLRLSALAETLLVTAGQVDQPLTRTADSVTVISGDELETRQITSLGDALGLVPGFTVARSGGPGTLTSLFPRGGESDFTLVLVDGVRTNAFGGGLDLSQVPLADVERIEVVRGAQSAIFGADAIGGVVQVITRQGGRPSATALIEGGSRATRRLQASSTGSAGAFRWQTGADFFDDDGFTGVAPANGDRVSNDDAEERQAWAGGGWRGARGTDIQGSFRYVGTDRGAPGPYGSDPAGRFAGVDRVSRGTTDRKSVGVRLVHPWMGPAGRVRQRVDFDTSDYDLSFVSGFGPSSSETRRTHARVQTDAALDAGFGVSGGVEWLSESGRSSFIQSGGDIVPVDRRIVGAFGEGRWNALERLSVQAGVRAEHISRQAFIVNGFSADTVVSVNPKLSASWLISPAVPGEGARHWTRLRAAAGTGIRPPDVFEIAFTDNPALKPERSRSLEAGVTQAIAGGIVQLDATAFFNRYDDLIISVGSLRDVSRYRTDNVSNARARGLELGGTWQAATGVSVRAFYTLLDTEIRAVDNSAQAPSPYQVGDPLLRRPRHSGSLNVSWTRDRVKAFGTIDARGETLDAEPAFGPSGGLYTNRGRGLVDVGGAVRLVRRVDIYARVLNLLDRDYEEVLGFPSPGRTAFVGVRLAAGR